MSAEPHVADAEAEFMVISVTPDFCRVGGQIVPYDLIALLPPEKFSYAQTVSARSEKVLLQDSLIAGVLGNAGKGVESGVSLAQGNVKITSGASTVLIESRHTARHGDSCEMNGAA